MAIAEMIDEGMRHRPFVGDGEIDSRLVPGGRDGIEAPFGAARELQRRPARRQVDHAHVAPPDAGANSGTQRLGAGLFGGKALGVGLDPVSPSFRLALSVAVNTRSRKRSPWRSITLAMRRTSVMSEPMPRIMAQIPPSARPAIHRGAHGAHRGIEAVEDRLADEKMPDVEFDYLGEARDPLGGDEIEAVSGMNFEPGACASAAPRTMRANSASSAVALPAATSPRTRRRCEFRSPARRSQPRPRSAQARRDEQRNANSGLAKLRRRPGARLSRCPTTSRPPSVVRSSPPLRNDAGGMRPHLARDRRPFRRVAAISRLSGLSISRLEPHDIVIDDVTAVFAQVRGDAVGAGRDRDLGGLDRIGMLAAARVTDGGDMVDVDAEAEEERSRRSAGCLREAQLSRSPARRWRSPSSPAIAR